jgi:hypothetical protein
MISLSVLDEADPEEPLGLKSEELKLAFPLSSALPLTLEFDGRKAPPPELRRPRPGTTSPKGKESDPLLRDPPSRFPSITLLTLVCKFLQK